MKIRCEQDAPLRGTKGASSRAASPRTRSHRQYHGVAYGMQTYGALALHPSSFPVGFISEPCLRELIGCGTRIPYLSELPTQPSPAQLSARMSPSFSAFLAFTASSQSFSSCFSS